MTSPSKPEIIALAACHECGSRRGQPCVFSRAEDPYNARAAARQSHTSRVLRARRVQVQTEMTTIDLANDLRL